MEFISTTMDYIIANYDVILGYMGFVVMVASAIARVTPSDSDNALVAKTSEVIDFLALNKPKKK